MAKLKCNDHKRRVVDVGENKPLVHRNGDGSKCFSNLVNIGGVTMRSIDIGKTLEEQPWSTR